MPSGSLRDDAAGQADMDRGKVRKMKIIYVFAVILTYMAEALALRGNAAPRTVGENPGAFWAMIFALSMILLIAIVTDRRLKNG